MARAIAADARNCGPLTPAQAEAARGLLDQIHSVEEMDAAEAARLFNSTGRRRGIFQECLIAAVAIRSGAALATHDGGDFERFENAGLTRVA